MGLLVTFLQGKLAELYVKFKKIEEIIDIYEDTCGKVDERFQSAYDELLSLNFTLKINNHVFADSIKIGINFLQKNSRNAGKNWYI